MNANPVIGGNITQTLFNQNEQLIVPSDSVSTAFQNLTALSGVNSMPEQINNMQSQMPAYLSQAHLSTWYQDNPWETLMYGMKHGGVSALGGNLDLEQPPGHRPGNTIRQGSLPGMPKNYPSIVQGMNKTQIMRENFENSGPVKIQWQ
jgi:hypothetical protein